MFLRHPQDVPEGLPKGVGRTRPLELNIRPYGDALITSSGDVLETFVGNVPWRYILDGMGTSWGCYIGTSSGRHILTSYGRGGRRPSVLHRVPYSDVHRASFWDVLRTYLGRNFAEWENLHYIIFYYVDQTPLDVQWRNRKKWNDI